MTHKTAGGLALMASVVLLVVGWPAGGAAERVEAERPVRAVVAPSSFRVYASIADRDFDYSVRRAFRRGVTRYLANHDDVFRVVTGEAVGRELRAKPLFEDTLSVAEQWAELGIESYKRLRTDEAIEQLENAVDRYEEIRYGQINPDRVAEVLMYLALAYLNQGENAARPLVLMKRMIRLDPGRVLRRGYYPDKVVNFYASAREDILRQLREEGPKEGRAEFLLDRTAGTLALFGNVFPRGDGQFEVRLMVYSAQNEAFLEAETATIPDARPATLQAAGNRLISRLAPCIYETDDEEVRTIVQSRGKGPLSIQINATYASFLQYPRRLEVPFGNMGAGLEADLLLTREFGLRAEVQVLNSLRDFNGFIVENFNTVRSFLGPDIGVDVGDFNFGVSVSLEGTSIGNFVLCEKVDQLATGCNDRADQERYDELGFMMGVNARPRIRFHLIESFEVVAAASYTYFFLPVSGRVLNNPLSGDLGLRYRF